MAVRVIAEQPQEVTTAIEQAEQVVARSNIDRLELAIKAVEEQGVHSEGQMEQANEILLVIAEGKTAVEKYWNPKVSAAHALHKMLTTARGEFTNRFDALRLRLERPMKAFRWAQIEEKNRRQREIDQAAETLRKQKEAEARQLMKQGDVAAAKELRTEARAIVAPVLQVDTQKLEGNTERQPWMVEVTDPMALLQDIAAGKAPIGLVKEWNLSLLKTLAKEMNGLEYHGVKAWRDISFAVSRK